MLREFGEWLDERLGVGAPLAEVTGHRVPRQTASWWYVFGSGTLVAVRDPGGHRRLPRDGLRALGRRRLAEPRGAELRAAARLVPARGTRLGLELHGRHDEHPRGAGVPLRRLQVPARADLDRRRLPAPLHARDGVHRPGAALRSGRLLGPRHRRGDRGPHAAAGTRGGAPAARRPDHRGRDVVALLHAARLRDAWAPDRLRRDPPAAGAPPRRQRVADARPAREPDDLPPGVRGAGAARRRAVLPGCREARSRRSPGSRSAPCSPAPRSSGPSDRTAQPDPTIIRTTPRPDFYFLSLFSVFALLPPWTETVPHPHRARAGDHRAARAAVHLRNGREELAAPARVRHRGHARRS